MRSVDGVKKLLNVMILLRMKNVSSIGINSSVSLTATTHQDRIYALDKHVFEMYNAQFDTWYDLPFPRDKIGGKLVSINDKLLLLGGRDKNDNPSQTGI